MQIQIAYISRSEGTCRSRDPVNPPYLIGNAECSANNALVSCAWLASSCHARVSWITHFNSV